MATPVLPTGNDQARSSPAVAHALKGGRGVPDRQTAAGGRHRSGGSCQGLPRDTVRRQFSPVQRPQLSIRPASPRNANRLCLALVSAHRGMRQAAPRSVAPGASSGRIRFCCLDLHFSKCKECPSLFSRSMGLGTYRHPLVLRHITRSARVSGSRLAILTSNCVPRHRLTDSRKYSRLVGDSTQHNAETPRLR